MTEKCRVCGQEVDFTFPHDIVMPKGWYRSVICGKCTDTDKLEIPPREWDTGQTHEKTKEPDKT